MEVIDGLLDEQQQEFSNGKSCDHRLVSFAHSFHVDGGLIWDSRFDQCIDFLCNWNGIGN